MKIKLKWTKYFKDEITLDLTQKKNYEFNDNMTKNNLIKNGVIFGKTAQAKVIWDWKFLILSIILLIKKRRY